MGYRIQEHRPPKPNRTMQGLTTPYRVYMENGQTVELAIPCFYQEVRPPIPVHRHCRPWHDHVGWPSPSHPDHSCQEWDFASDCSTVAGRLEVHRACERELDLARLVPVHFKEEYGKVELSASVVGIDGKEPEALTASASLDDHDDWVVRLSMRASADNDLPPVGEPERYWFTVTYKGYSDENGADLLDSKVLCKGEAILMPVAYAAAD